MKYIMVRINPHDSESVREFPVIFPSFMNHDETAEAIISNLIDKHEHIEDAIIVSAGFINSIDGSTYGRSETLDLESRPDDQHFIRGFDYHHGIM